MVIARQPFGQTGHLSTRTIFGGAALGRVTQAEADRTLEVLFKCGINHIDTAPGYGESELRIGGWMPSYRGEFFLATKTSERTRQGARDQIQRSLERLRVAQVDLIQLHNLTDQQEWEVAMGPGGALEAAVEAREQGLVRFIGVTGHGVSAPMMHRRSLERYGFDSVLLPCNYPMWQNAGYAADFAALLALCQERKVAVQTIKSLARGPWGEKQRTHATWYDALSEQASIDLAVHWVLGQPSVFLNTCADTGLLPMVLDAASRFQAGAAPTGREMTDLVSREGMTPLFA
ncbi:MAG: aldo/keto reductase [Chloroflexi bacterium]|nr:aldo/keto reductase [Chloroflexota bacterium]